MLKLKNVKTDAMLLSAAFIWGLKPAMMKIGLMDMKVKDYNSARLIIAALVSWIVVLAGGGHKRIERKDIPNIFFVAVGGFFIFQWFYAIGIIKTTASGASLIMGTVPLMVALINKLVGHDKGGKEIYIGGVVSLLGLILVLTGAGGVGTVVRNIRGSFYIFISAAAYSIYTVFVKPLTKKYPVNQITAYCITITAFITLGITGIGFIKYKPTLRLVFSLVYTGAIAMYLGNFIWMWGIRKAGSIRVSIYNNVTPVFSVIAAGIILDESFTMLQLMGMIIIFLGIYIGRMKKV